MDIDEVESEWFTLMMDYDDPLLCMACGERAVTDPQSNYCAQCDHHNFDDLGDVGLTPSI